MQFTIEDAKEILWIYPKENKELLSTLIAEFNIHPITAQVLISRGFKKKSHVRKFLYAKLPQLEPPETLCDIDKATKRVFQALENNENILILGDNDVDGITGTALLMDFLRTLGTNVFFYIPSRHLQRDSIVLDAMDYALQHHCSLMITVDCGITARAEIETLTKKGMDVIITDHHEPTDKIPHCIATLNPKLIHSTYKNRELTGVGVAFKLAHAMMNFLVKEGKVQADLIDLKRYLDLVALGTISDMGALTGENRILVRYGLQQVKKTYRIGLIKLIHVCDVNPEDITTLDISSKIAPRLNSLGRIGDPRKGVELLLLRDVQEAESLAHELDILNKERQQIERKNFEDIKNYLEKNPKILEKKALVIDSDKLHSGIIPIISARLAKQYNRPTVILSKENGVYKGSIRTIPEFPVLTILKQNKGILESYGGHDFAAGLNIDQANIEQFRKNFIKAAESKLKSKDVSPKLYLDAKVSFQDLTFEFLESLNLLSPYGTENPQIILYTVAKQVLPPKVVGKEHLKLSLEENDRFLEGIGFNMGHKKSLLMQKNLKVLIAFTPQVSVYLNRTSIQLHIRDFKVETS